MDVNISVITSLRLEQSELVVLSKALRGELTDDADKVLALAIQEKMILDRHTRLKQMYEQASVHAINVNEARAKK